MIIIKVFLVERRDYVCYCEDYAMVVIAIDAKHAERKARWENDDFKKAKLEVTEIDMNIEQVVLKANKGA